MRQIRKRGKPLGIGVLVFFFLFIQIGGCSPFEAGSSIEIISWNVQNLFDGIDNGKEYPEFDPGQGKWNDSLFHDRLEKISEIIIASSPPRGPDILILEEIENGNCIDQLNQFYLPLCGYRYHFTSNNPTSIQTAILSRCPIQILRSHRISCIPDSDTLYFRDIMEAEIELPESKLLVFINHWKSRRGGVSESEHLRIQSSTALNQIIQKRQSTSEYENHGIIICGDLNESHDQFSQWEEKTLCALMPWKSFAENELKPKSPLEMLLGTVFYSETYGETPNPLLIFTDKEELNLIGDDAIVFYSPWEEWLKTESENINGNETVSEKTGSYFFNKEWDTIDHFLISKNMLTSKRGQTPCYRKFEVIKLPQLLTKGGIPKKWITRYKSGYSDHLPIKLLID